MCDGSTEFTLSEAAKADRGTDVVLHVADDSEEFLEEARLRNILTKYCKFLPIPVFFGDEQINQTTPIWTKAPSELTDEDYTRFYQELYPFAEAPLFWIHLNVDYPFNLTGILYFPKVKDELQLQRNKIQLYSRQVFITDEVKDVVPDFLMLLHGVLDSPDIPLNVSRSFLQADASVRKINTYITKKVADKLGQLFRDDRAGFEQKWPDIGLFVKYGMLADDKFYERAKDFALVQNTDGRFFTLEEYRQHVQAAQTGKNDQLTLLYTPDVEEQHAFVAGATARGYDVLRLDTPIDPHFVSLLEQKLEKTSLKRVDADPAARLIEKDADDAPASVLSDEATTRLKAAYEAAIADPTMRVTVVSGAPTDEPVLITRPEFMRRLKEQQRMGGGGGMMMFGAMPDSYEVSINANHPLAAQVLGGPAAAAADGSGSGSDGTGAGNQALARQAFDLALLQQGMLKGARLTDFIRRSVGLLSERSATAAS